MGRPGGQHVRILRESRLHPLSRSHLPYRAKIRFVAEYLNNDVVPSYPLKRIAIEDPCESIPMLGMGI
mgnify:CR=1 FL=1